MTYFPGNRTCGFDEFRCHSGDQCIGFWLHCNGHWNCLDGSDESGCGKLKNQNYPKDNSTQCLHCLPFCMHLSDPLLYNKTALFKFCDYYSYFSDIHV